MKGGFITVEGVEGCGKSTQILRLKEYLTARGYTVDVTREPGGTPISEALRRILLDPAHTAMAPVTELLLYEAARAQHVAERIRPAIGAGTIVLCDRFADSTTAYQAAGRGLPEEVVRGLHGVATGGIWPDLTIVIDLPAALGLQRAVHMGADRIEQESLDFHERVREAFLRLAQTEPGRVKVVDGNEPVETVAAAIARLTHEWLEHR